MYERRQFENFVRSISGEKSFKYVLKK
jgi:hypothetical protein